jgi:hypothetical protein
MSRRHITSFSEARDIGGEVAASMRVSDMFGIFGCGSRRNSAI